MGFGQYCLRAARRGLGALGTAVALLIGLPACGMTAPPTPCGPQFPNLTGVWASNGGIYFLRQTGETLWWAGLSADQGLALFQPEFQLGLDSTNVFQGSVQGDTITGEMVDVPRGTTSGAGTLGLQVDRYRPGTPCSTLEDVSLRATASTSSAPEDERWIYWQPRFAPLSPPCFGDAMCNFQNTRRNDNGTMWAHMSADSCDGCGVLRDNTVVYGRFVGSFRGGPSANFPYAGAGTVNGHPVGRSYGNFLCAKEGAGDAYRWYVGDGDPPDGDINFGIDISGFPNAYDNATAQSSIDYFRATDQLDETGSVVHVEVIMYGRDTTSCSGGSAALLPGWADEGANSALLDGRPMDGANAPGGVVISNLQAANNSYCITITSDPETPCAVTSILGHQFRNGELVRVTGFLGKDEHGGSELEIHPAYSIDAIAPTASADLSGVWGSRQDDGTYYLREETTPQGGKVLWWLRMSADRGFSVTTVFRGTETSPGSNAFAGEWADVPLGLIGRAPPFVDAGSSTYVVASPTQIVRIEGPMNGGVVIDKLYP
jgi:hypothetical protein